MLPGDGPTDPPQMSDGEYIQWLEAEVARLKNWVSDCQSGMYINCVYCGHRYGPWENTPVAMADVLKEHIEKCPEHPLSHAKAELAAAKTDGATLQREHDNLARALFEIRSLTMRKDGHAGVANIACDAVRHIDEAPLFPPKLEPTKGGRDVAN